MTLAPEIIERIQAVEARLGTLDPILRDFCARHSCAFSAWTGVWPRRRAWRRREVDQHFDLTMDWTVPEVMARGFSPDMPWSLHISASTHPPDFFSARVLTSAVFRGLPFSSLHDRLEAELDAGLATLRVLTPEVIHEKGRIHMLRP